MGKYIPEQGDFAALTFNPQSGHEQKGRRPAIVVSKYLFNKYTGLAMVCPISNKDRKIPFHLKVPDNSVLTGFVMVDQIKSVDYNSRKIKFIDKADKYFIDDILAILESCIY